jgi:hypothetical protein
MSAYACSSGVEKLKVKESFPAEAHACRVGPAARAGLLPVSWLALAHAFRVVQVTLVALLPVNYRALAFQACGYEAKLLVSATLWAFACRVSLRVGWVKAKVSVCLLFWLEFASCE